MNQDQLPLVLGLEPLIETYVVYQVQIYTFEEFYLSLKHEPDRLFLCKSHWKQVGWANKLGGVGC